MFPTFYVTKIVSRHIHWFVFENNPSWLYEIVIRNTQEQITPKFADVPDQEIHSNLGVAFWVQKEHLHVIICSDSAQ